jgi:hypothetical protein
MSLADVPADLLRALVALVPEIMGSLALVNKTFYDALLGPEVGASEPHWRVFVTQRRWPAYTHIEAGKYEHTGKTWRDLARGWRDLLPWNYIRVQNPHWTSCGNLIRQNVYTAQLNHCPCGWWHLDSEPVVYRDAYFRITKLPEPDPDEMIGLQYPAFEIWNGPWSPSYLADNTNKKCGWNPRKQHVLRESGFLDELYVVAAPESDLANRPKFVCIFKGFS